MRSLPTLFIVTAALAYAPAARATPNNPGDLQTDLGLSYTPPCSVCHVGSQGAATATTDFALAMKARGLGLFDDGSVKTALAKMQSDMVDSDCNGIIDTQQLIDGRDPNAPGEFINGSSMMPPADPGCMTSSGTATPAYGCGAQQPAAAQLAPGAARAEGAGALLALVGAAFARLRFGRRARR
jgi:hypothetical protein